VLPANPILIGLGLGVVLAMLLLGWIAWKTATGEPDDPLYQTWE